MTGEARIALTPVACESLIKAGHTVYIQNEAGVLSGYPDEEYLNSGVLIIDSAEQLYSMAKLIVIFYSVTCTWRLTRIW